MPLRFLEVAPLDRIYMAERDMVEFYVALTAWIEGMPIEAARLRVRAKAEDAIAAALVDAEAQF
jgi:hypothetical protein